MSSVGEPMPWRVPRSDTKETTPRLPPDVVRISAPDPPRTEVAVGGFNELLEFPPLLSCCFGRASVRSWLVIE